MIDADVLLPDDLFSALPGADAVQAHAIPVNADRWSKAIANRGLPSLQGKLAEPGHTTISRAEVFDQADREVTTENAFQLLYYSLAWGLGIRAPRLHARLNALAADPDRAGELLLKAWETARAGAPAAEVYSALATDRGSGRIRQLGPAFATKFLYFAQGAAAEPRLLILDAVVAGNLAEAWPGAATWGWYPQTYGRYCDLMANWAGQATERLNGARKVRADEIELVLFRRRPE
ncbi:hypothetical protein [Arthrobacter gengyunqii]|uniref:Uncharacterized protein n=1 Tax=Arthrobacter gengyunqii TaxID=2886940 RepID=A0ABS8GHQ1_9MICC|nr:hypothetical protein [Arthrobacter gengyunqii]MCC3265903.1 hypothetical protein [Arthrobacter gengyunqii]